MFLVKLKLAASVAAAGAIVMAVGIVLAAVLLPHPVARDELDVHSSALAATTPIQTGSTKGTNQVQP